MEEGGDRPDCHLLCHLQMTAGARNILMERMTPTFLHLQWGKLKLREEGQTDRRAGIDFIIFVFYYPHV